MKLGDVVAGEAVAVFTPIADAFAVGRTGLIGLGVLPIEVDLTGSAGLEERGFVPCDVSGSFGPEPEMCLRCCRRPWSVEGRHDARRMIEGFEESRRLCAAASMYAFQ